MVNLITVILQKDGIKRGNARTQWEEEEKEMKRLFQKGAELSYLEGLIDGDTKQKYFMSGMFIMSLFLVSKDLFYNLHKPRVLCK